MIGYCARVSDAQAVKDAGFDYLEVRATEVSADTSPVLPIVAINNILPRSVELFGPDDLVDTTLELLDNLLAAGKSIGVQHATFGSGRSRRLPQSAPTKHEADMFVALLQGMDQLAMKHRVAIGLEPLATEETNFVNTLSEARYWLDRAGCVNMGITADSYHFYSIPDSLDELSTVAERVGHIHIAAMPGRTSPANLTDSLKRFLSAISVSPRDRRISVETDWRVDCDPHQSLVQDLQDFGLA